MRTNILYVILTWILATGATAQAVQREYRAVWLTTYLNLDWPLKPTTTPEGAELQKQELCTMLDQFVAAGLNTVFVQARMRSTVAYKSAYEPWDEAFTGTPGKAPLYDPLAFAVEECHKRGLECHAWVVAFPICKVPTAKKLGKKALPRLRPELCQRCGDLWMMDPGVPETADYLAAICKEIVENYDVDGIHLDYIRYPEREIRFNDTHTYRKYGKKQNKATWRRNNVTRCVSAIHTAIKSVRPWVRLSCAPIGKHDDLSRQSSYGWNARTAVSQDAQQWLKTGIMDALFPMMYFDGKHYYPFAADWQENCYGRPVVPGLGIYFLNKRQRNWPLEVVQRQMNTTRQFGLGGQAFFRAKFLVDNEKGLYDWLQTQFYAQPAFTPPMTWADSIAPKQPKLQITPDGVALNLAWNEVSDNTPVYYNIYRIDSADAPPRLLAHKLRNHQYRYVPALPTHLHAHYSVTAVDAYGNESAIQPTSPHPSQTSDSKQPLSADERLKKVREILVGKK